MIVFPVGDVTFRLSMCFAKPRISGWDFPHSMSPDGISDWKIWYFRNPDDWRTPHKYPFIQASHNLFKVFNGYTFQWG